MLFGVPHQPTLWIAHSRESSSYKFWVGRLFLQQTKSLNAFLCGLKYHTQTVCRLLSAAIGPAANFARDCFVVQKDKIVQLGPMTFGMSCRYGALVAHLREAPAANWGWYGFFSQQTKPFDTLSRALNCDVE